MDNCLVDIPNPSNYFDSIMVKTLIKLNAEVPEREIRNKLWDIGENYKSLLKNWNVVDIDDFWEEFDRTDFDLRKKLIKENRISLFSDVIDTFNSLMNLNTDLKFAIISNTAAYTIDYMLKYFNLNEIFDEIFALSSDITQEFAKPNPEGILITLGKLDFNSESSEAIMIGDSITDIIAAKRAGIDACLIRRNLNKYLEGYDDWEFKPDLVIDKLSEILDF